MSTQHISRRVSSKGDDEFGWNPDDPGHVAAARARYEKERTEGMIHFRTNPDGMKEKVHQFDPKDAHYTVLAPAAGG